MIRPATRTAAAAALGLSLALSSGCGLFPQTEGPVEAFDSAGTTARVKAALAADDLLSLVQIEVETFRDVVQLSGFVDDEAQVERAGEVAAGIGGVREVRNDLVVKPAA